MSGLLAQALGVAVELSPASVSQCIEETRLGFMYAPYYHPVMKSVKAVRSALQVEGLELPHCCAKRSA